MRDPPVAYQELCYEDRPLPAGDPVAALKRVPLGDDAWASPGAWASARF